MSGKADLTPQQQRDKLVARLVRELLKNLDSWESQGHSTVQIAHLRRHFGRKA